MFSEEHPVKKAKKPNIGYDEDDGIFYIIKSNKEISFDKVKQEVEIYGDDILDENALRYFHVNPTDININKESFEPLSPPFEKKNEQLMNTPGSTLSYDSQPFNSQSYYSQPFNSQPLNSQSYYSPPPPLSQVSEKSVMSAINPFENIERQQLFKEGIEEKFIKIQNNFLAQDPPLISKEQIARYKQQYNTYWDNKQENMNPIANPEKCFTFLDIESNLLNDMLIAKKMCYSWRDKGPRFGISGELSIAGLTILAMKTLREICDSDILNAIKKIKAGKNKSISWIYTNMFLKNFQSYFFEAFNNIESKKGEGETRDNLESVPCKLLTTLMLNVLEEFKKNYFVLQYLKETKDQEYLNFLVDSFFLLERIILIKSSLDVSQAEGLNELIVYNFYCLFNSYDYSAVLNTPYCPVLASGKFQGYDEINYIYDDIAIFEFLKICKTTEEIEKLSEDNITKKIYNLLKSKNLTRGSFYDNIDVSSTSTKSQIFTQTMNEKIDGRSVYLHLMNLADQDISQNFDVPKSRYQSVSKLFLNYNSSRGVLDFKNITSNSRDIRAHDYANSPIRFFGISIYIKKKIKDFLRNNNIYDNNSLNELENDEQIKNILKSLNKEKLEDLVNFILKDESLSICDQYKNRLKEKGKLIQLNKDRINNILLDESYDPLEGFIEEIKDIYILMCGQNADLFESSQELDGLKKVIVYEKFLKGKENEYRVLLCNKPLFRKGNQFSNENEAKGKINEAIKSYNLDENTIGIVDLCNKRGGVNRIIYGNLVETTITEADAAHASLGFYTKKIHNHKDGELFLNDIKLATVCSGDYKGKYDLQGEVLDPPITSFQLLYNLTNFNITADNAIPTIQYLISKDIQDKINKYIEQIEAINSDLGKNIETEYSTLISNIESFINTKPKKVGLRDKTYEACSQYIRIFISNVNLILRQYIKQNRDKQNCNLLPLIDKIGEELYFILHIDMNKFFMLTESNRETSRETSRSQRGKNGGGKDDYECLIENNSTEKQIPINLFRGKFGSYIDVVNGKFLFKEINTEEELKNIEMRLGIKNDLKEDQSLIKPIFSSPRSVEELPGSLEELKMNPTKQVAGKTIKRRRRIKTKTRRINNKNKNKHKRTIKVMKKKAKMTKGRKQKK